MYAVIILLVAWHQLIRQRGRDLLYRQPKLETVWKVTTL